MKSVQILKLKGVTRSMRKMMVTEMMIRACIGMSEARPCIHSAEPAAHRFLSRFWVIIAPPELLV